MKQILCVLAISLVMFSCSTKRPEITLPDTNYNASQAFDSFKLQTNTFYRLVLKRGNNVLDSSVAVRFTSKTGGITEYKVSTDTFGLHLNDSVTYTLGASYSEHQFTDPNYYASSVGYVYTKYAPMGGSTNSFLLHDYLVIDTFYMRIGTPITYATVGAAIKGVDTTIAVTIYK